MEENEKNVKENTKLKQRIIEKHLQKQAEKNTKIQNKLRKKIDELDKVCSKKIFFVLIYLDFRNEQNTKKQINHKIQKQKK